MVYDIKLNLNQLGGLFIISKPITYEDALKLILSLPYKDFQKVVKTYSEANKSDFKKDMELLVASDFENRLSALNVNNTCPQCSSSHIVKIGKENNIQRYQCKDCKKKFTLFTGTILEKTKWHWDLWVKVLEMVLNDYSVIDMKHTLETDYNCAGIDKKTIWHWRMKLIHALASLPRVNELHSDLKKYINTEMTNVASKYLQDYIGFFTFRRNWRIANGHYPTAQKDAEEIFIQILQKKINYTLSDIEKQQLDLPKPTDKYNSMLIEETQKARYATANNYFKFSEEDGVIKFNKRKYLNNLPKSKLLAICKEYNLTHCKKMCRFNIISLILQQPNIEKVIYKLIENDRSLKISEEDLQAIKDQDYIT